MQQSIGYISLLVPDYDAAIAYYTEVLGFELLEDTVISPTQRWVLVRPRGATSGALVFAEAKNEAESAVIGKQAGGRVFLFLHTDDFWRDYTTYRERGVHFREEPREEAYGTVAVFEDRYGNPWDLLEPKAG